MNKEIRIKAEDISMAEIIIVASDMIDELTEEDEGI